MIRQVVVWFVDIIAAVAGVAIDLAWPDDDEDPS